ncbi:MAG: LysE family translocator [Bacteroidetes bacterium]|nr:LysE family translocator [Bacteroidota bacterium]
MISQGVIWGISLSFMIGPLLFSIIEAGIVHGFRAGLAVALGIWVSDILYVGLVVSGMDALAQMTALPGFKMWSGVAGACLLSAFGIGAWLKAGKKMKKIETALADSGKSYSIPSYVLRGFLLNTVNPFTVFFWLSITGAVIIPNGWDSAEALVFFAGMLGTLVVTDTLKAYGAREIRRFLTPQHTFWVQRSIGALLLIFGLVLLLRVF